MADTYLLAPTDARIELVQWLVDLAERRKRHNAEISRERSDSYGLPC
jgi:hypothetical protein